MKKQIKYFAYLEPLGYYCSENASSSGFTDNINRSFEYKTYRGAMKRLLGGLRARENYKIGNLHLQTYADCEFGYIITVEQTNVGNKLNGRVITKLIKKEKYNYEECDAYLDKTNKGLQKIRKQREELLKKPEYRQDFEKGDESDDFWN